MLNERVCRLLGWIMEIGQGLSRCRSCKRQSDGLTRS